LFCQKKREARRRVQMNVVQKQRTKIYNVRLIKIYQI
jgi:hypothetical protein